MDMPTSAEEIAKEPSLDEILDVDSVPTRSTRQRSASNASSSSSLDTDIVTSPPVDTSEPPSLTVALSSAWKTTSWRQRLTVLAASVLINVGLPFVNGVMLGFGELFARNVIGVRLGWATPFPESNTAAARATSGQGRAARTTPRFAAGEKHSASVHTLEEAGMDALASHAG